MDVCAPDSLLSPPALVRAQPSYPHQRTNHVYVQSVPCSAQFVWRACAVAVFREFVVFPLVPLCSSSPALCAARGIEPRPAWGYAVQKVPCTAVICTHPHPPYIMTARHPSACCLVARWTAHGPPSRAAVAASRVRTAGRPSRAMDRPHCSKRWWINGSGRRR
jgi:hypothetical protein